MLLNSSSSSSYCWTNNLLSTHNPNGHAGPRLLACRRVPSLCSARASHDDVHQPSCSPSVSCTPSARISTDEGHQHSQSRRAVPRLLGHLPALVMTLPARAAVDNDRVRALEQQGFHAGSSRAPLPFASAGLGSSGSGGAVPANSGNGDPETDVQGATQASSSSSDSKNKGMGSEENKKKEQKGRLKVIRLVAHRGCCACNCFGAALS